MSASVAGLILNRSGAGSYLLCVWDVECRERSGGFADSPDITAREGRFGSLSSNQDLARRGAQTA